MSEQPEAPTELAGIRGRNILILTLPLVQESRGAADPWSTGGVAPQNSWAPNDATAGANPSAGGWNVAGWSDDQSSSDEETQDGWTEDENPPNNNNNNAAGGWVNGAAGSWNGPPGAAQANNVGWNQNAGNAAGWVNGPAQVAAVPVVSNGPPPQNGWAPNVASGGWNAAPAQGANNNNAGGWQAPQQGGGGGWAPQQAGGQPAPGGWNANNAQTWAATPGWKLECRASNRCRMERWGRYKLARCRTVLEGL
ncbi:heterogeneous nuclear ribonucleoprotein A1-like [Uloborus diversus]|uniref:heterogeneous nuclear ribonucleoprotein A1-like n=1 Tax=Uloborus diversus TaxID=327109 RepID=UPI002409E6FF|nr:heterogeneous nuclear ribonucleoprotein A1-like [Uloborus diversus]